MRDPCTLLERDDLLSELGQLFAAVDTSGGKLVFLSGEAGVGKSSLLECFAGQHGSGTRICWAQCQVLETSSALGAVKELSAALAADPDLVATAATLFPWLLRSLSPPRPRTIVILEDAHWADAGTIDFIRYIGQRIRRTNLLLLVTYRSDELSSAHPVRLALAELIGRHVARLQVSPLSEAAVALLAREAGRDPETTFRLTGGNPFFLRELLSSPSNDLPQTVRDAIIARLQRAAPTLRAVAELVALGSGSLEIDVVREVLGPQAAEPEALDHGLLASAAGLISFRHELARLAVESSMSEATARSLHLRLVQCLVNRGANLARIAHHAVRSGNAAAVTTYVRQAAEEASRLGAHREAGRHWQAVLDHGLTLDDETLLRTLASLAQECRLSNQPQGAIRAADRAAELAAKREDTETLTRMLNLQAVEYRTLGERQKADACVMRAMQLTERQPHGVARALTCVVRSELAVYRGWNLQAVESGEQGLELARELQRSDLEAHALINIGGAHLGAAEAAGYAMIDRALAIALEHGLEELAAFAYRHALFYAVLNHEHPRAERVFHEGVEYCEERGLFAHSAYMRAYYTLSKVAVGAWDESMHMAEERLRSPENVGTQQRISVLTALGLVRLRRGDPQAREPIEAALRLALPTGEINRIGTAAAAIAEADWYRGETAAAAASATLGLEALAGHSSPWVRGELLLWARRCGALVASTGAVAAPYRHALAGDWQSATGEWGRLGMPYHRALALAEGPAEALLEALGITEQLGASPLADRLRALLRARGVRNVPRGPRPSTRSNRAGLTRRESQVLGLLASGLSNPGIGRRLNISAKTVENHLASLFRKLEVSTRTAAVAAALGLGLVAPNEGASPAKRSRSHPP